MKKRIVSFQVKSHWLGNVEVVMARLGLCYIVSTQENNNYKTFKAKHIMDFFEANKLYNEVLNGKELEGRY